MNQQIAQNVLLNIQDNIRLADTKAGLILAISGVLVGFTGNQVNNIRSVLDSFACCSRVIASIFFLSFVIFLLLSVIFALITIRPRLSKSTSPLYFGYIGEQFKGDPNGYLTRTSQMDERAILSEYAEQIVVTSAICVQKHRRAAASLAWLFAALVVWIVAIVIYIFAGST